MPNKIEISTVFLDIDGVLTNFKQGVYRAFNQPYSYETESQSWLFWEDFDKVVTFKQVDDICGKTFWGYLPWMHDGKEILGKVVDKFKYQRIYLLSDPMPNVESMSGKWLWVKNQLSSLYNQTILLKAPKELLAKPDTLLIDDRDKNIEGFCAAGGHAILVPRPHNVMRDFADVSVEILSLALRKYQISS